MRRLFRYTLASTALIVLGAYALWTDLPTDAHYLSDLRSEVVLNQGLPGDNGNLLGIQPEMFSGDYHTVELLRLKLGAYLHKARDEGLLNGKTVAVLPEHIGTWLVISGEKAEVYQAETIDNAMAWLAASNPLKLSRALLAAKGEDRLQDALLRMKSAAMARDYQAVFGGLAKDFGITLVAGSIVLPDPRVEAGQLVVGDGPLYNVSLVFGSDGAPLGQPQRKVYPIRDEQTFTAAAPASDLRVVDTPAGRLGVLICADSWYPAGYAELSKQNVKLLAVPAFLTGNGNWSKPWGGYNGAPTPSDVALQPGAVTEGQAWQQLAMANRLGSSGAQAGMTVFMRGQLWNLGSDGQSLLANGQDVSLVNERGGHGGRLLNIWL
jgi:predicted amidohydrolase